MLLLRMADRWRFLVIPRADLLAVRDAYVQTREQRGGPGRPPVGDDAAKSDTLTLEIVLNDDEATGWGASLAAYVDRWPEALAPVPTGPGTVTKVRAETPPTS